MDPLNTATDPQLLRDYLERGSERAFHLLVERHVNLVFGTARRRLADEETARELTQNVFATLARKAAWLLNEIIPPEPDLLPCSWARVRS